MVDPSRHFFPEKGHDSLVDGGGLRTFLCNPMHTLRSSGYTLSGIYIDDLSWSPHSKKSHMNHVGLIHIKPLRVLMSHQSYAITLHECENTISSKVIILNTISGKFRLGDHFISLNYTILNTNSRVSAGVHTLAKKSCFSTLFGSHPPDY